MTASRSTSGGNAPRSRSAASCPRTSPVVPSTSSRRNASRCGSSRRPVMPEVEQRGAAVGLHDEVAAVQVAVEHAVDQRAFERRDEAGLQQRVGVDAGRVHRLDVVEREAAQPLHHEHAPRDHRGVRARHDDPALVGAGEHVGDVEHVLGLEPEVELLDHRLREQLDERRRVGERGDGDAADRGGARATTSAAMSSRKSCATRGRCTLTTTSSPVMRRGRVHLRDRGRRDRLLVERRRTAPRACRRGRPRRRPGRRRTTRAAPGRGAA